METKVAKCLLSSFLKSLFGVLVFLHHVYVPLDGRILLFIF